MKSKIVLSFLFVLLLIGVVPSPVQAACNNNLIPRAAAGPDRVVSPGVRITFNGSGSTDDDGSLVSYWWSFGDSSATGWQSLPSVDHLYTATGTYAVLLWVKDNCGHFSLADRATVTVRSGLTGATQPPLINEVFNANAATLTPAVRNYVNQRGPIVTAASNQGVITWPSNSVTLNASINDDNPSLVGVTWTGPAGTNISNRNNLSTLVTFSTPGSYVFTVTAHDNGVPVFPDSSAQVGVTVNEPPVANAGIDQTATAGVAVNFDGSCTDSDGTVSCAWSFGDGGQAAGEDASHVYTQAGTYLATLTATDNYGATGTDTASVIVDLANQAPVANATVTPTTGNTLTNFHFNGGGSFDPDGTISGYNWNFGDGNAGSGAVVDHIYPTVGSYNPTLTVIDNLNLVSTPFVLPAINVASNDPCANDTANPTPVLTGPTSGVLGEVLTFSAASSTDPNPGQTLLYWFNWGDGSFTGWQPLSVLQHTYNTLPINPPYHITLWVRDTCDLSFTGSATLDVNITGPTQNEAPVISGLGAVPANLVLPNRTTTLGALVTDDGLPNPPDLVTATWSQISGPTGSFFSATSTTNNTGSFAVSTNVVLPAVAGQYRFHLTASDSSLNSVSEVVVNISSSTPTNQPPVADAEPETQTLTFGQPANFTGANSFDPDGSVSSYVWNFGDGITSTTTVATTSHLYNQAGTYLVNLKVFDNGIPPLSSLTTDQISVTVNSTNPCENNQPPVADAGPDQFLIGNPDVFFSGSRSYDPNGSVDSYQWFLTDGSTSNGESFDHRFSVPGAYQATLTVTDNCGFSSQADSLTINTLRPVENLHRIVDNAGVQFGQNIDVNGNSVIYSTSSFGVDQDVYRHDLITGTNQPVFIGPGNQVDARVSNNLVVWSDTSSEDFNLQLADLTNGAVYTIVDELGNQGVPDISGNLVVWADNRSGDYEVYLCEYNPVTHACSEYLLTGEQVGEQSWPRIDGTKITYTDFSQGLGNADIYWCEYNSLTHTCPPQPVATQIADQGISDISGDKIVWLDNRNLWDIFLFDLSTGMEHQITTNSEVQVTNESLAAIAPRIFGNHITWSDFRYGHLNYGAPGNGNWDAFVYDLSTNTERQLTKELSGQYEVVSDGNRVVWADNRFPFGPHLTGVTGSGYNNLPQVDAGDDQAVTFPNSVNLFGSVIDDNLPNPPGVVTTTWYQLSGPSSVTFSNPNSLTPTADFAWPGTYNLRLMVDDGEFSLSDDVTITVNPNNPGSISLVKDINLGSGNGINVDLSDPVSKFITFNGRTYFAADDGVNGVELWQSDGTPVGTTMVKDINPFTSSGPIYFTFFNNQLYFLADDGINGLGLWKTNGTLAGTVLVKGNFNSTGIGGGMVATGNSLYFTVVTASQGFEVWKSDGTTTGTLILKDIVPGSGSSNPRNLTVLGNQLFFSAQDSTNGREPWISNGTEATTFMLLNIAASGNSVNPFVQPVALNNNVFFSAQNQIGNNELWKTNGTATGTVLVKEINTDLGQGSNPDQFRVFNNQLFFSADDSLPTGDETELWKTDGSTSGTVLVHNISPTSGSYPKYLTPLGSNLLFSASFADGSSPVGAGTELWKTNGADIGTTLVKDINPGFGSSDPRGFASSGGFLYFVAANGGVAPALGQELWRSDGTTSGTVLLSDVYPGFGGSNPRNITVLGNEILFSARDSLNGYELWKYTP